MALTKRQAIDQLRDSLKERNADSTYSNQFLYRILEKHAKWLVRREESANRIYKSTKLFDTYRCVPTMQVSATEDCGIEGCTTLYRTVEKLPEIWEDTSGPMIKSVTSIDFSYSFQPTSKTRWTDIENNPYNKYNKTYYYFYSNGYIWFPIKAPKLVNIDAFFKEDVSNLGQCSDRKSDCKRFLDTEFKIPEWIEGELFGKAIEELAGISKRMQEDEQIDSNPTRKS